MCTNNVGQCGCPCGCRRILETGFRRTCRYSDDWLHSFLFIKVRYYTVPDYRCLDCWPARELMEPIYSRRSRGERFWVRRRWKYTSTDFHHPWLSLRLIDSCQIAKGQDNAGGKGRLVTPTLDWGSAWRLSLENRDRYRSGGQYGSPEDLDDATLDRVVARAAREWYLQTQ
jgi:hypothetical protein